MKLKLIQVQHVRNKQGKEFVFCFAETKPTPDEETPWSSIRWQAIFSDNPPPADWKAGAEVEVRRRSVDYEKGTGVFDVKTK